MALWLSGCVTRPPLPAPRAIPLPQSTAPSPEEIRQRNVAFFLERAEAAQREGFLTQPAGASAYDYYLRVKQLDPDNRRAASGIQTIVIEFVERARDALRRRAFGEVNSYLSRAEELAPGNALVAEVRAQLVRERSRAKLDLPQGETVALPAAQLAAKSDDAVALLRGAAERIRRDGLRVIIVARTDAEGRWIYQQLREAVPGYRIRGDIKLGNPPRLLLITSTGGGTP
ncbi:N-acetylglucosaminyltransferase [Microbulbifer marinus]|nr:N-acetylglucosaminyltransferase [Microbulbifer marinus]